VIEEESHSIQHESLSLT